MREEIEEVRDGLSNETSVSLGEGFSRGVNSRRTEAISASFSAAISPSPDRSAFAAAALVKFSSLSLVPKPTSLSAAPPTFLSLASLAIHPRSSFSASSPDAARFKPPIKSFTCRATGPTEPWTASVNALDSE